MGMELCASNALADIPAPDWPISNLRAPDLREKPARAWRDFATAAAVQRRAAWRPGAGYGGADCEVLWKCFVSCGSWNVTRCCT